MSFLLVITEDLCTSAALALAAAVTGGCDGGGATLTGAGAGGAAAGSVAGTGAGAGAGDLPRVSAETE